MSTKPDRTEIEDLLRRLVKAHADRDADAIVGAYAPDAVIYDLAPPLGRRGMNRDNVASWLGSWDGPIRIDARDLNLTIEGNLAFASALHRMHGSQNGEEADLWYRTTICLRKTSRGVAHHPRARLRAFPHGWELPRRHRSQTMTSHRFRYRFDPAQ